MNGIEMCVDETDDMMQSIALRMATSGSGTDKVSGSNGSASEEESAEKLEELSRIRYETWRDEVKVMNKSGVIKVKDTREVVDAFQENYHIVVSPSEKKPREEKEEEMEATDEEMLDAEHEGDQDMPDRQELAKEKKDEDVDLPPKKLYEGSLAMDATSLQRLIYKVDRPDDAMWNTYRLLKNFRHPAVDTLHMFYVESLQPRVVLSWLDCMLRDLVRSPGSRDMFFTKNGCLTTWFRDMVLDMCSGLEHLFMNHLYPREVGLDDLYVCKYGPQKSYSKVKKRIKWLILKVEKIQGASQKVVRRKELWEQVRDIIEKIHRITKIKTDDVLNVVAQRFVNFIGNDVSLLENYPDSWSLARKGHYLISIISADMDTMEKKLNSSSLDWPVKEDTTLPNLISKLIEHDENRPYPYHYSLLRPYDYLKLCRTVYKHHHILLDVVRELKDMCPKAEDFIERMEIWQPNIWCNLYEAIGLLDCPRSS